MSIALLTTPDKEKAESLKAFLLDTEWINAWIIRTKRPLTRKVGGKLYQVTVSDKDAAKAREAKINWKAEFLCA